MRLNVAQKIIKTHLVAGQMEKGYPISIRIDQTLTQDSTGTMAYLQWEAMGHSRIKTELSVAYIDHNMLQEGFENADDHRYIQTAARKYGLHFSRPGNGICHQVHLERFGVPGKTLLGSDSHTPTCGGIGMLAMGAGGLDVAVAMGGGAYDLNMPEIILVRLTGKLQPFVTAKDIILEVLRKITVTGGVGKIIEYGGEGVLQLTVPQRATITNMGAELGATTSLFPSDEQTKAFLEAQKRGDVFTPLQADEGAIYDAKIDIDLSALEPLTAAPHSPDNVKTVASCAGMKIDQVAIGSCTNGSFADLMSVAAILKGKTVHPDVSLVISPGSKQVLTMLAKCGALSDMVEAGARILESGCGPCIGMGQAPATNAISLRTFNRNFKGRCGTATASVYLVSPETAAISAVYGVMTDPRTITTKTNIEMPTTFLVHDNMIEKPLADTTHVEVLRGPNIKPFPQNIALPEKIEGKVLIKVGDHITTDHIMPSNAKLLPFRSNVPYLAEHCLVPCDPQFPTRAKEYGGGFVVGGENYGQGSSREHAALVPLQLGIKAVIAKSFARIHKANLINSGILPLTFETATDYDMMQEHETLIFANIKEEVKKGNEITATNEKGKIYRFHLNISDKERNILLAGGKINQMRCAHVE